MKTIIINNTEFTEIEYIYDGETYEGLYVHDLNDINHDGDAIYGNGVELPATEEDANFIIRNEFGNTCFHEENGIYYID